MTPEDYLARITSWNFGQPDFTATVRVTVAPFSDAYNENLALFEKFDLDTAQGPQLDVVGEYVGRSRAISVPPEGIYFTWGSARLGWGRGIWKGPYDQASGLTVLDDDTYRRLIRAKIAANVWDGTAAGAQAAFDVFFDDPDTSVFVQDDFASVPVGSGVSSSHMKITVGVAGKIPSRVLLAVLGQNLIPLKPAGVTYKVAVTSVDAKPLFGWGISNDFIGGWGSGAWGVSPQKLLAE